MNFLFPTFLIGLTAVAIPIIIHLFNFRRYKKVYFTNVQFLKELKQESDSKSKLKEWLILACRILAISCLVLAFAQPYIPGKTKTIEGNHIISVYIDNSFTMENTNKKGSLLENAKQIATDISKHYSNNDRFQIITNDFEGKHQRILSKEEFNEAIDEIKISSSSKTLNDVIKRQQDFLRNSNIKNKNVFLISDFQKNTTTFDKATLDTNIRISCVPIASSETNNIYIDSVWFENPVQQYGTNQMIHANIINKSSKDIENSTLKLYINNKQVSLNSFNIAAGNKKDVSIPFTIKENGINNGLLKIEDYPISYDDEFYFSFNSKAIINTLVINGKESKTAGNFTSLFKNDSLFNYKENNESAIDYSLFSKTNLIICNELNTITSGLTDELKKFVSNGGSLVIFPGKKSDITEYNSAFAALQLPQILNIDTNNTQAQIINFEQGLYEGVFEKVDPRMDMPKTFSHFTFTQSTKSNNQIIISLQNGQSFLSLFKNGLGKIYLFSVGTDEQSSNFIKHALFVPTLLKMAILSLRSQPLYHIASQNDAITIPLSAGFSEKPAHIIKTDNSIDIIPEQRIVNNINTVFTRNQINDAGYYTLVESTKTLAGLAFNFNRRESDMSFYSDEDLQKMINEKGINNVSVIKTNEQNISNALSDINEGKKLWKLFLILALVFLLAETLIIRLFK